MKKDRKKNKGVSSAVLLSIAIHGGLFLLAGMLVVFTVVKKEEQKFEPPKVVERPKMKLKKPKVKVRKTSKPKPTTRIVTKMNRANMPEIQLPEMSGMSEGFGGEIGGGFDMMPDLEIVSVFGSGQTIGNDLEGTFYDFNRRRGGNLNGIDQYGFDAELQKFNKSGWKESVLAKYYRSPKKLYATTIALPPMPSPLGPAAFNEPDNEDRCWIVLYKGTLVHRAGIKFRFVGNSDDKLAVRVDGEVVLDACREDASHGGPQIATSWIPSSADHRKWYICHDYSAVGDLVELEPGVPKDIEIIIGEGPGTLFNAILYVMEEGVEYEKDSTGTPILPVFKTAPLSRRLQDMIYRGMPEDQVCVTGGPVFNDYDSSATEPADAPPDGKGDLQTEVSDNIEAVPDDGMRTWTTKDGKIFEGEFVIRIGNNIVLKTIRGRQKKIPRDQFAEEDLEYVSLAMPPTLKLEMSKKSNQRKLKYDNKGAVGIIEYTFSPKIEWTDKKYNHELKVDYWVIGSEIGGSRFILLDKGNDSFVPLEHPEGRYRFSGKPVDLYDWVLEHIYRQRRGERYKGFLITVTDERGVMIANRSSPTWLYKNLDNLEQLELGSFLDDECNKVWPTPLKPTR